MSLNPLSWFSSKKADEPVWTVDASDVKSLGRIDGLYKYEVVWRKGPQSLTGTYAFPTEKPLEKVLYLARSEV
jgi:hypothetical protein